MVVLASSSRDSYADSSTPDMRPRLISGRLVREDGRHRKSYSGRTTARLYFRAAMLAALGCLIFQHYLQKKSDPSVTNFGLFATRYPVPSGGFIIELPSTSRTTPLSVRFCSDYYWSNHTPSRTSRCAFWTYMLCHHRPLLWDKSNWAYTTHRVLSTIYMLASALMYCFPWCGLSASGGIPGTAAKLLFMPPPETTQNIRNLLLWTASMLALENVLLYPIWLSFARTVQHQHLTSIFHLTNSVDYNYAFNLMVIMAVVVACVGCFVVVSPGQRRRRATKWLDLQLHAAQLFVAVMLGYYRGAHGFNQNALLYPMGYYSAVSKGTNYAVPVLKLTWTLFVAGTFFHRKILSGDPIHFAVSWLVANFAGSFLGSIQYQNTDHVVRFASAFWWGFQDSIKDLFGG